MLNVAAIIGRLTADPELKSTTSGISVCSFTVAVDKDYVKQGEERQTDFIDVVAWKQTAEFVCKYFHKGSMIAIDGSIQTRNYEDRNGNKRKTTEVVANRVHFCGKEKSNEPSAEPVKESPVETDTPQGGMGIEYIEFDDDDLPF